MRGELLKVLAAALDKRRRDDSLEQAVGREARRAGLVYADYMEIVQSVRETARKEKADPWAAAKKLLEQN